MNDQGEAYTTQFAHQKNLWTFTGASCIQKVRSSSFLCRFKVGFTFVQQLKDFCLGSCTIYQVLVSFFAVNSQYQKYGTYQGQQGWNCYI